MRLPSVTVWSYHNIWIYSLCCTFLSLLMFTYFWDRERGRERESVRASGGGAEREGDRGSKAGSALISQPDVGLKLTNCEIVTRARVGRSTNWATQVPLLYHLNGWPTVHVQELISEEGKAPFPRLTNGPRWHSPMPVLLGRIHCISPVGTCIMARNLKPLLSAFRCRSSHL